MGCSVIDALTTMHRWSHAASNYTAVGSRFGQPRRFASLRALSSAPWCSFSSRAVALHSLEEVRVAAAHLQLLGAAFDAHQLSATLVAQDAGDGARVDERR